MRGTVDHETTELDGRTFYRIALLHDSDQISSVSGVSHGPQHVVDRSVGVPDAEKERIFAAFQRLDDRSSSGHGAGVGLGLAVARGFVEAMGGELTADDPPVAA